MKFSKYIFALFLTTFLLTNTNAQKWGSDKKIAKEERKIGSFHSVSVGGGIDLYISQGRPTGTLRVEASAHAIDRLATEVEDGELRIFYKKRVRNVRKAAVYITINDLDELTASGGSDIASKTDLKFHNLKITSSGGSDVELDLRVDKIECTISGGSDLELRGGANVLILTASGGSDFDGFKFKVKDATIRASGGSDSNVYVSESIDVRASGASDVDYKGNPSITKLKSSGASDISSH